MKSILSFIYEVWRKCTLKEAQVKQILAGFKKKSTYLKFTSVNIASKKQHMNNGILFLQKKQIYKMSAGIPIYTIGNREGGPHARVKFNGTNSPRV